uniref:Complex 1 LYR protein domain-containing protein n=1 Tax=Leptobrachium leishanense TaxID=445787 RepID=A0A8C5M813_9ANUR
MASSSRSQVLSLYKTMLRESGRFSSYNYRSYAIRRIKDAFREKKNVHDSHEIQSLVQRAKENLEVIKRQFLSSHTGTFLHSTLQVAHSSRSQHLLSATTRS